MMKAMLAVAAVIGILSINDARANAPSGRYTQQGATVVDNKTGLTWEQSASTTPFTWTGAKSRCSSVGAGWRVPTIKELQSLVDYARSGTPKIDTAYFPGTPFEPFWWSSTAMAGSSSDAWYVDFDNGSAGHQAMTDGGLVRCVRETPPPR